MTKKELVKVEETQNLPTLAGGSALDAAKAIAVELSKSDIIPKEFQNKPANCLIAVELANRMKASPFQVMQNVDIIYSRPAPRSSFIIACINNSGKYIGSLKFQMDEKETKCRAWAIEKETGEKIFGPTITLEMAEKEGWATKNGSKWKTLPALMLRYRAAAFFGRLYCPEILMGMYTADEVEDMNQNNAEAVTVVDAFNEPEPLPETIPSNRVEKQKAEKVEVVKEPVKPQVVEQFGEYEDIDYDEYYASQDEADR